MTNQALAHYLKTQLRAALVRRDLADATVLVHAIYGVEPAAVQLPELVADQTITAVAASRRIEALALASLGRPYFDAPDVDLEPAKAWVRAKKESAPGFSKIKTSDWATLLVLVKAIDLARQAAEWRVSKPASLPPTVFLLGETGTGKEMLAEAMAKTHFARIQELAPGDRITRTFGAINCAGLAEDVVESELFGHVKGSFTGASGNRAGLLAEHQHGVVLLDEIGDAPLDRVQPRLLRFLQNGEVRAVGSDQAKHVYPWVIAATNHPEQLREELQHRLGLGRALVLPPLAERGDDAERVLLALVQDHASVPAVASITNAARRAVTIAPWPGNLRELDQIARDVAAQNYGQDEIQIELDDLPEDVVASYQGLTPFIDQMADLYADYVAVAPPDEHAAGRSMMIEGVREVFQTGALLEVALLHRLRPLVASKLCAHWLGDGQEGLLLAFDQRLQRIEATLVAQLDAKLGVIDGVPAPPPEALVLEPETAPKIALFLLDLIEGWATSEDAHELARSLMELQAKIPPAWRSALETLPTMLPKEPTKAKATTTGPSPSPPLTASEDWKTVSATRESLSDAIARHGSAAALAKACDVAPSTVTKAARDFGIELPRGRPPVRANAPNRDSESRNSDSMGEGNTPPDGDAAPST